MTDQKVATTAQSGIAPLFFFNRATVWILVAVIVIAPILLPGLGSLISMLVAVIALIAGRKAGSVRMVGLSRPESWTKTLAYGGGLGIGLQVLFHALIDPLTEVITGSPIDLSNLDNMTHDPTLFVIWLAIGWVVGGFLEELAFRGYLIGRVRSLLGDTGTSTIIAVALSVIPFGIAHLYQGWAGVLSTGLMGLSLALIFVFSKCNLWIAVLAHGFANTLGLLVIFLGWSDRFRLL